jgi:hypothetical protein
MNFGCRIALAIMLTPSARAQPAASKPRSAPPADQAACDALGEADDRLRVAFSKGSPFPDQVYAAFAGQGSGDATAGNYLNRGQDLYANFETVFAQCRAAYGRGAGSVPPAAAALLKRRAQDAKHSSDLYLDLPATIARIDAEQKPPALLLRGEFLSAMYKIADGAHYEAASALADDAHAKLAKIP